MLHYTSITEKDPSLVTRYKHKKIKEKTEKKMEKLLKPEKLDKEALEYKGKLREPEFVCDILPVFCKPL
ncbi:hypothetical protein DPMN_122564 [Dreissena polymorpha]|uniref:Uncharacterized protein n=1 Tax=Dreissena polymorpha TaxID=45954 RepID=A0A9D4GSQ7_DREPO|nr:hypothetical protein DPMN_122434 [Dreissena polymorpha]KAH3820815.1 hypothetical protein DPMN_122564 [Dreissena polymorpha]